MGGHILEGASSNIFVVKEGQACVLRSRNLESWSVLPGPPCSGSAAEEGLIAVEEGEVRPEDLFSADEAFITSSIREVMPVVSAEGHGRSAPEPPDR